MHYCYVITISEDRSFYADLGLISIRALRIVHPKAKVTILVDEVTDQLLSALRHPILEQADDVRVVQTGMSDPVQRSRFVKTSMRAHMNGDFLYIDVDAMPVRSLAPLWKLDCDIAAAIDHNYPPDRHQLEDWVDDLYQQMNWTYDAPRYYNSGVMLFRDTPKAHELGALWHQRWLESSARGCNKDQPSLNSCLPVVAPRLAIMPNRYNSMVFMGMENTRGAAMLHFWISGRAESDYIVIDELYRRFKKTGQVDELLLRQMVRLGYAWVDPYWIEAQWRSGHYWRVFVAVLVKGGRRLKRVLRLTNTPTT